MLSGADFGWTEQFREKTADFAAACGGKRVGTQLYDAKRTPILTPTLHVLGTADPRKPQGERLATHFAAGASSVIYHPEAHVPPKDAKCVEEISSFVMKVKRGGAFQATAAAAEAGDDDDKPDLE